MHLLFESLGILSDRLSVFANGFRGGSSQIAPQRGENRSEKSRTHFVQTAGFFFRKAPFSQ